MIVKERQKPVPIKPTIRYITIAVRSFSSDLAEMHNWDPIFVRAANLAFRQHTHLHNFRDPSSYPPRKVRATVVGRKARAPKDDNSLGLPMLERHLKDIFQYYCLN